MNACHLDKSVGGLVVEHPGRARVFERWGIDYCCGGKRSLRQACVDGGIDEQRLLDDLQVADAQGRDEAGEAEAWDTMGRLVDNIVQTHHVFLRRELPRLTALMAKVRSVHGERHPELSELQEIFLGLVGELESHMAKEEQVLFPMLKRMDHADTLPEFHCGSVRNPISVMEYEHDQAGEALARMRELTGDYEVPDDGCESYQVLLDGLQELEADLHQHIHKENNILFPMAQAREAELAG